MTPRERIWCEIVWDILAGVGIAHIASNLWRWLA